MPLNLIGKDKINLRMLHLSCHASEGWHPVLLLIKINEYKLTIKE